MTDMQTNEVGSLSCKRTSSGRPVDSRAVRTSSPFFALEHHFTGYSMSPDPTQLLSYFAGRTKRITLGTAVIVLPWHDPVRVAEEAQLNLRLFADRVLPRLLRDAAFAEPPPAEREAPSADSPTSIFAPA
jgi:Luciferase-like monooxygenase